MINRRILMAGAGATVAGCAQSIPQQPIYEGAEVTRVVVYKNKRIMQLLHDTTVLRQYKFELGFAPEGHKVEFGDGRTPEGAYRINRLNPNSRYHRSLGISYPNRRDIANARARGVDPGGDIFIHGTPKKEAGKTDWTYGCIAIKDSEVQEMYDMVKVGTPIVIYP